MSEEMGIGFGIAKVIDGGHLNRSSIVFIYCSKNLTPDSPKAVDADLRCHFVLLFYPYGNIITFC
jgi:hypothetical protein